MLERRTAMSARCLSPVAERLWASDVSSVRLWSCAAALPSVVTRKRRFSKARNRGSPFSAACTVRTTTRLLRKRRQSGEGRPEHRVARFRVTHRGMQVHLDAPPPSATNTTTRGSGDEPLLNCTGALSGSRPLPTSAPDRGSKMRYARGTSSEVIPVPPPSGR